MLAALSPTATGGCEPPPGETAPSAVSPGTPAKAAGARDGEPLIVATGISKAFGGVQALKKVDLEIWRGEVHGLIGANGAGKSTFIRILAGDVSPDAGTVRLDGKDVVIRDPRQAGLLGFAFLHQELSLIPKFGALENMALGLVPSRFGLADTRASFRSARAIAAELDFDFPLDSPVNGLSVAQQWLVALGRSLMRKARLIALDEPTASLSAKESAKLFEIIGRMADDGIAVLYVSHRLEEVEALSNRVTVFRDGEVAARFRPDEVNHKDLVEAITGSKLKAVGVDRALVKPIGPVVLATRRLTRRPAVQEVSLELHAGEIVGLAGLVGSGRTELARLLFGADRAEAGEILLDGRPVSMRSPAHANRLGIGLLPEERRGQALFLIKDVVFNVNIATGSSLRVASHGGPISMRRARARAQNIAERVELRPPNVDTVARKLSGGNQQKVVLGRWLVGQRRVLILDEPTRGIDVGTRAQIHRMLRELADSGMALLLICSEFGELRLCNRVLVMRLGQIVQELHGDAITEARMLSEAYGVASVSGAL